MCLVKGPPHCVQDPGPELRGAEARGIAGSQEECGLRRKLDLGLNHGFVVQYFGDDILYLSELEFPHRYVGVMLASTY